MRFVIIRRADEETEAGAMPTQELVDSMMAFHLEMAEAGIVRGGDGLQPSSKGARVTFKDGKPTVIDGPFAEAKELVAGFTLIEVDSKETAIEWMKKWPVLDGHGNVGLELRQLYEMEDFGEAVTPEAMEISERVFKGS